MSHAYDLIIKNLRIVRPQASGVVEADVAVKDGRFSRIAPNLPVADAKEVQPGDVLVAGRNCGAGSSREQAPQALKHLGVAALVAESFAGLFYRNALNLGLSALVCAEAKRIRADDRLHVDPESGRIDNLTTGETLACEPIPSHLMQMIRDGGLLGHLEKRLKGLV